MYNLCICMQYAVMTLCILEEGIGESDGIESKVVDMQARVLGVRFWVRIEIL